MSDIDPNLNEMVASALRSWGDSGGTPDSLLSSLMLVQEQRREVEKADPTVYRMLTNNVLLQGINLLERRDVDGAKILRERFIEGKQIRAVALSLRLSTDQTKRRQRQAIEQLGRLIAEQETAARSKAAAKIEDQLPVLQSKLFGMESKCQRLIDQLLGSAGWIVGVIGIGGIGKTSLANSVVRNIIYSWHFKNIIWLDVENEVNHEVEARDPLAHLFTHLFPDRPLHSQNSTHLAVEVQRELKQQPHLIVVDNIEDEAVLQRWLRQLRPLTNPTKVLFTSRIQPDLSSGVFTVVLEELAVPAAGELLRHHAEYVGVDELKTLSTEQVDQICQVIGGNPLALKLVVGLARFFSLSAILDDLGQAHMTAVRDMYVRIYWKIWQSLSPSAQTVLEAIPAAGSSGIRIEQLEACTGLMHNELLPSIAELIDCSLLEVGGSFSARHYRIHRLTESFLATEIIGWPGDMRNLAS